MAARVADEGSRAAGRALRRRRRFPLTPDGLVGPAGVREYVSWATEDQAAVECAFGEPIVSGERAAIEWWAVITSRDGSDETVAGTSIIRFDQEGRVVEDCAYWAIEPGRREPPPTFKAVLTARG